MNLRLGLLAAFTTLLPAQTGPPFSTFLKANVSIRQIATDPRGNIYVLGDARLSPIDGHTQDVFIARLDPAASKFTYLVYLGGSADEVSGALAVDAAGNAYVTGYTNSTDFPTLPQSAPLASAPQLPFAAKLDANGGIIFSTLFSSSKTAIPQSIAVDKTGAAIISGIGADANFPATTGAFTARNGNYLPFVTKLDPAGAKLLFSAVGIGGTSIAIDVDSNIFIAGTLSVLNSYPTTPGAFQTTYRPFSYCVSPSCGFAFAAGQQYVTKLSADGSKLLYSTYLTGSQGSMNSGLAVDAAGNAWVTGKSASTDYPYTEKTTASSRFGAFTTELDPTGSKVLLSVHQGGSSVALAPDGSIVVADSFPSNLPYTSLAAFFSAPIPPPPAAATPSACLSPTASGTASGAFAMRLNPKDGSIAATRILPGSSLSQITSAIDAQGNFYVAGSTTLPDVALTPGVFFDPAISARTTTGAFLARTDLIATSISCVTDSTAGRLTGPVAPGQLITIYGSGIGPAEPAPGITPGTVSVPISLAGVEVTFDGRLAPILYASSNQINVQVPFEVTSRTSTVMQLSYNGSAIGTQLFAVVPRNPSLFLASWMSQLNCGSIFTSGPTALALNQDGSINSCSNPAKAGSDITLFLNGLGVDSSNRVTGSLTASDTAFISARSAVFSSLYSLQVDSFTNQHGVISGIGQLQIRVPSNIENLRALFLTATINDAETGPFTASTPVAASSVEAAVFAAP